MARRFDIGVRISGEDKLSPEMKKAAKSVDLLDDELGNLNRTIKGSAKGVKDTEGGFSRFASGIKREALVIGAAIAGGAVAFRGLESAGARIGQRRSLERALESQNIAIDGYLEKLDEAARGTVSTADLIASSSRALLLGIPAEEISKLLEIARASAVATGESVQKSFDDITKGIGRASPLILDNLGIIVKQDEAYKKLAAQLGKTVESLTGAEKSTAFLNAVLEVGTSRIQKFGEAADKTAETMQRAKSFITDTKNAVLEYALTGLGTLIQNTEKAIDTLDRHVGASEKVTEATNAQKRAAHALGTTLEQLSARADKFEKEMLALIKAQKLEAQQLIVSRKNLARLSFELRDAAAATDVLTLAEQRRRRIEKDLSASTEEFREGIERLGITLSTEVNKEIEANNRLLELAEERYKLGGLKAEDFERVQRDVAAANLAVKASRDREVISLEAMGESTTRAIEKEIEFARVTGNTTAELEKQAIALNETANAANAIPSLSGGEAASSFATIGGGTFTRIDPLPTVNADGTVTPAPIQGWGFLGHTLGTGFI